MQKDVRKALPPKNQVGISQVEGSGEKLNQLQSGSQVQSGVSHKSKKIYDFLIQGVPYKLKTAHDPVFVEELVDLVNSRMTQAAQQSKNASFQNAAVLTALNLAEELALLKKKAVRELEKLEEKTLRIAHDLENSKNARFINQGKASDSRSLQGESHSES